MKGPKKNLLRLALYICLFLSAFGLARAQPSSQYERLATVRVALASAITKVEQETNDRVFWAAFAVEHDRYVWDIESFTDSGIVEYRLDAQSGRFVRVTERPGQTNIYKVLSADRAERLRAAKLTAADAVRNAEQASGAVAESLDVSIIQARIVYLVRLRNPGKRQVAAVDAVTGHISFN
jgi:uncharacterized membrane protein YkoI